MTSEAPVPVRERLLESAYAIIERSGWSGVTMSAVAGATGVSRQTVYNEFGTKHGLAEHLALRELQRFLDVVSHRMAGHTDLVAGVRSACEGALLLGEESVLVRTIAGSASRNAPDGPSADSDFLKLLTTESGEIVEASVMIVQQAISALYPPPSLSDDELAVVVESVVRLVLSAMTRPSKPPAEAAADIAWIVGLTLDGAATRAKA